MKKFSLPLVASIAALQLSAQIPKIDFWEYSTAVDGDGLQDVANTGSENSPWNFNTTSLGDVVSSGVLEFTGGDDEGLNESYTRKATPASPIALNTLGSKFRFEVTFSSWDLSNVDTGGSISFKLNGPGNDTFAQVVLEKDSDTTARMRWSSDLSNNSSFFRNEKIDLTNAVATSFAVDFTLGGIVEYYRDGSLLHDSISGPGLNFGGVDYLETLVVKDFTGDSGAVVGISSFGFSAVPEPGAYSLIAGTLGLAMVLVRRRR